MRVLLVTPFLPCRAASHGAAVYLSAFAAALATHAEVGLVSFVTPAELAARLPLPPGLRRTWLVVRPELRDLGPAARLRHRLRMLRRWSVGDLPVVVAKFRSSVMERVLKDAAQDFRPTVVMLEMDLLAPYLRAVGSLPTVLTDHEAGDAVPAAIGPGGLGAARDRRLWARYVPRTYAAATRLQALNDADAARLAERLGRPVGVRPPLVPIPATAVEPGRAPARLLFFGDYRHHPNPEAAAFVAREVLPRVRARIPGAELWIAGANATPAVEALGGLPGVRVAGFVADLRGLLASGRALVAPVFSGGGSRIKVLTALAHGLPVVANRLALRGISAPAPAVRCGETADEIAAATLDWLHSSAEAAAAGAAARAWATVAIAPDAVAQAQLAAIDAMLASGSE